MGFLDDYEPVEDRLREFWKDHPDGRIVTNIVPAPEGQWIVRAQVWRGPVTQVTEYDLPTATGLAHEVVAAKGVNSTSALENCETSAIGRALANLGYAAKGKRPSREEMAKTEPAADPNWKRWVWDESAIFKRWTEEERKTQAVLAMERVVDGDLIANAIEAQAVLTEMRTVYESEETGQLPITEGNTK